VGNYKFLISGGGTGGHIFPAIAIGQELQKRFPDAEFLFVGAKDKMEMEKVPQAGFRIEGLWISGFQRKLSLANLIFPFKLLASLSKAKKIIRRFKPNVAIGTGGFASGPVLKMAAKAGLPYVLQEQNSYAGVTNKLLAKKASAVCVAYPQMERFFPKDRIVLTGNPIRKDLLKVLPSKDEAKIHFGLDQHKKTLLILGGSLGARRVNQLIETELAFFADKGVQLLWQCGKLYAKDYKKHAAEGVKVLPFVNRMDMAYGAADLIISRAGAGSVSELALVGKPLLLIPSPNVAEDHQTKNAQAVVQSGGARMLKESELEAQFQKEMTALLEDEALQTSLTEGIRAFARPRATEEIADVITQLLPPV
jgi:UDP-N-acetylglucosamine--N-acetylmuramyl-(pentapeptide) pyrophosphoryl-undecaprenol N-acetylglucosamine transferase